MKRISFIGILAWLLSFDSVKAQVQLIGTLVGSNFNVAYPANLGSPVVISPGFMFTFKSTGNVTGPTTISVNTGSPIAIKKQVSIDLQSGDILAGQFATIIFDGNFFQLLNASSSSQTAWLTSGNTLSGTGTLGTLNQNDLSVVTGGIERIRITSTTGNIGFGTNSPIYPVHIRNNNFYTQGQTTFTGSMAIENTHLSNQTTFGIGLFVKSNATQYGVGAVFESGQQGIYARAITTGTGSRIGVQGIGTGGDNGYGLYGSGDGINNAYGVRANGSSLNGYSYGVDANSNSTNGYAYGIKVSANSTNGDSYGINILNSSDNGLNSYGAYISNYNNTTIGNAFGSYIYNTGNGPSYGTFITNYGGTGYSSIGLYASAFNGTANYAGYFANGDVYVNDKLTIGYTTPKTLLTIKSLGANWDLTSTNGDIFLGDDSYNFRIGIATGGGGAGDVFMGSNGGTSRLVFNSGSNVGTMNISGNRVQIGIFNNYTNSPILHVYNPASPAGLSEVARFSGGDCTSGYGPMITFQNKCSDFTPSSFPDWISAAISSPYSGSYAGDLSFHTNDGSITTGNIQSLERVRIRNNGNVGINTSSADQKLVVNGFTRLGNSAPAIQLAYFTGVTSGSIGGTSTISLSPITSDKIISIQIMVDWTGNNDYIQPSYSLNPGYFYNWYTSGSTLYIINLNNATANPVQTSTNILSKPVKVIVTYEP